MKAVFCAIAALATVTSVVLPVFQVSARPLEPDYPCYVRTNTGQVIDLTRLCPPPLPSSPQPIETPTPTLIFSNEEPRQENQQNESESEGETSS